VFAYPFIVLARDIVAKTLQVMLAVAFAVTVNCVCLDYPYLSHAEIAVADVNFRLVDCFDSCLLRLSLYFVEVYVPASLVYCVLHLMKSPF